MRCQLCHCLLNAIFLIAACAIPDWAGAQNAVESSDTRGTPVARAETAQPKDTERLERAERDRIQQERVRMGAAHEASKAQCYQRFLVNDCLLAARDQHNAQLADLKRQENSLSDTQRKRRGALQVQRIEQNTSPQRLLEQAEQRGNALADTARREQRQADKLAQQAEKAAPQAKAPKAALARAPRVPSGPAEVKSKSQSTAKKAVQNVTQKQPKVAPKAQRTQAFDQRIKDAQEHRAEVEARLKKNKKPPSAPLPIPLN